MRKKRKNRVQQVTRLCIVVLMAFNHFSCRDKQSNRHEIKIIPNPVKVREQSGYFILDQNTVIETGRDSLAYSAAFQIQQDIKKLFGWHLPVNQPKGNGPVKKIILQVSKDFAEEGYLLNIDNTRIEITGGGPGGILYGYQSLKQLLPAGVYSSIPNKVKAWKIPAVEIEDYPRFAWRGFMLDVSRHFHPKEFILEILDQMALLKLNKLHLHLSDDQGWRVELKGYPKLTELGAWRADRGDQLWWGRAPQQAGEAADYGGYYTGEDIREMVDYAGQLNIEIIPEIDMPGHAQAILASYPELGCVGVKAHVATGGVVRRYNTINPGKEAAYQFVGSVMDELFELFPSKYIHIGGDECDKTQWETDPYCRQKLKEIGSTDVRELQSYFIKRVEKIVNAKGRRIIGWDEILEGGLAPDATVMSWRGEKGGIHAAKNGHDVIMSPSKYCYLDLKQGPPETEPELGYSKCFLSTCYSYDPVPGSLTQEESKHILGVQGNLWSESIQNKWQAYYMMYPRLFAIAENGWSRVEKKSWEGFIRRLEPQLERLNMQGINYAPSVYNVNITPFSPDSGAYLLAGLTTEAGLFDIRYTLDGSEPGIKSVLYQNETIRIDSTTTIRARAYKGEKPLGELTGRTIRVHKAALAPVTYTGEREMKTADLAKLTDLLLANIDRRNTNWVKINGEAGFEISMKKEAMVSAVEMNFLHIPYHYTYIPKRVSIWGSTDGAGYIELAGRDFDSDIDSAGGIIMTKRIEFSPVSVKKLKIEIETLEKAPKGHLREGKPVFSCIDEITVN